MTMMMTTMTTTNKGRRVKMADDVDQCVENALNILLSVTEKSGNLRNDLRKDILKAVSELRITFTKLKSESEGREKVISKLEGEVKKLGDQCRAASHKEAVATGKVAPSFSGKRNYAAAVRGDGTGNIEEIQVCFKV
jgi:ElaB/YqjD/DUF883 family membrane-anchored ribosome-binding protein